jgi:ureidoglycolate lyase
MARPEPFLTSAVQPEPSVRVRRVAVVDATRENVADYGLFVGTDVPNAGLPIPFYKGSVVEGHNLPFACNGRAVIRTAQIQKRSNEVTWLERHLRMTQLFVGLGDAPFVMVLGKPTHERGLDVPDLDQIAAFKVPAGHGILIHAGTWHDFPMAWDRAVTVLTASSEEVVEALAAARTPDELDSGDVLKIDIARRLGVELVAEIP